MPESVIMCSRDVSLPSKLVQKRLFQTIARNLVKQLVRQDFELIEIVDFANEILEEILDLASAEKTSPTEPGLDDDKYASDESDRDLVMVRALEEGRRAELDSQVFLRHLEDEDMVFLRQWQDEERISGSCAALVLDNLLGGNGRQGPGGGKKDFFVLCRSSDEKVVGLFGFANLDIEVGQAEFSKMIGESSERKKGYARKATRILIEYGFSALRLDRIYLHTLDGNLKNIQLNQSLGFEFEGLLRRAVQIDEKIQDVVVMARIRPH